MLQTIYLQSPLLKQFTTITHAFSTRMGGVSPKPYDSLNLAGSDDAKVNINQNRLLFCNSLKVDSEQLQFIHQVHDSNILILDHQSPNENKFDAMLTSKKDIALSITTADCIPLLLYDKRQNVIGAIHSGWRSTAKRILEKTLIAMQDHYNSKPETVFIAIGPGIDSCCMKVGEEVIEEFKKTHSNKDNIYFFNQAYYLDLKKACQLQALENHVPPQNIDTLMNCTYCEDNHFFSYRRENQKNQKTGRHLNMIMLRY